MQEKIVEIKVCKHCNTNFEISDKDMEFYEKVSPVFAGKKYNIPTPKLCPDCRQQRRLSFRNERKLYKRKCDATGKDIISIYSSDKPYKVYDNAYWWSDKWDSKDYGRDFDFNRSFFEQFTHLQIDVPRVNLYSSGCENCEYSNQILNSKNCYLVIGGGENQDCYYGTRTENSINVFDSICSKENENCYEITDCKGCYNCFFSQSCVNSSDLYFCFANNNSHDCILCCNLENKSFCINNKQLSQEEFIVQKNKILLEIKEKNYTIIEYFNKLKILREKSIQRHAILYLSENVTGDNYSFSKNCNYLFDSHKCENVKFSQQLYESNNCYDFFIGTADNCYEDLTCGGPGNWVFFSMDCWPNVNYIYYCDSVSRVSNCFGCVGLHNNEKYCILNKQYTKEQYEELVPKIIKNMQKSGEWGEFFPNLISPFGYNETVAQEYFPLTKEKSLKQNFNWSDYETPFPKVEKIIPANKLPENIKDIPDDILNRAIECEKTKKPFRIIKQELEFYRKNNLPIPKRHPDQRHLDRIALRNPRKLYDRKCDKCHVDMKTSYASERKEIVYCEDCYNKEVY